MCVVESICIYTHLTRCVVSTCKFVTFSITLIRNSASILRTSCYQFGNTPHLQLVCKIANKLQMSCKCVIYTIIRIRTCSPPIDMSPTQAKGSCKLRGKAAEVKHFTKVVLQLWTKHSNPALHIHRLISACLRASVAMEAILTTHKGRYAFEGTSCI